MEEGPVTLLNLTQFDPGETFKLIYSVGEIVSGPILSIGNPNCRVRVRSRSTSSWTSGASRDPRTTLPSGMGIAARIWRSSRIRWASGSFVFSPTRQEVHHG